MLGRIMQAAGIIVDHWGWRMIFYSLAVLCIIALVVAFFAMDNVLENEHSKLDILRSFLRKMTTIQTILHELWM